jgi:hypothetical protein
MKNSRWMLLMAAVASLGITNPASAGLFKIDFGQYVPDQRFDGLRRLTLNNMVQDRSMIREHVAYQAYAWLGVPAPRHGYAELWVTPVFWPEFAEAHFDEALADFTRRDRRFGGIGPS